jgi:hypothetical protein
MSTYVRHVQKNRPPHSRRSQQLDAGWYHLRLKLCRGRSTLNALVTGRVVPYAYANTANDGRDRRTEAEA